MHDDAFAQGGRFDGIGVGQRRKDVAGHFAPQRDKEQLFAHQRHATADHHHFRRQQRNDLGNRPAQDLAGVREHGLRDGVTFFRRLGHHASGHLIDIAVAALEQIGHEFPFGFTRVGQLATQLHGIHRRIAAVQGSRSRWAISPPIRA